MANKAKDPGGDVVQVERRQVMLDARTEAVIARIVKEVPGVDNRSAAIRWMGGPAEAELDRLKSEHARHTGQE